MTETIQERLRAGAVQRPRRWTGDTHADLGGTCDEAATDAIMAEAADALEAAEARIAELEAERNGLREALYVYGDRKKMGPVLLCVLEQYAAAREIVLRDEGCEG